MTPFDSLYGQHPRHQIDMSLAKSWLANIHSIQTTAAKNITQAHERHACFTNNHHNAFDPSIFSVGCQVMLNHRSIHTTRPSKKLNDKLLGPFTVTKLVGPNARRLPLPTSMNRLHPVFHTLLEPYRPSTLSGRHSANHRPPAWSTGRRSTNSRGY